MRVVLRQTFMSAVSPYLTRAADCGEHPALSVSNRLTLLFVPVAQDLHAAPPEQGADAIFKGAAPFAQQHPSVVITVDLKREKMSTF